MKSKLLLHLTMVIGLACGFHLQSQAAPVAATNGVTRVPVVFSGGHETDPKDGGRPVILVAGALGVPPEVFREAFSHVRPARGGTEPEPRQVKENKTALLSALGKYGVTNDRLDQVSNYYRYVPGRGQLWPTNGATAKALVQNGTVTGFEISYGGSGYSSAPSLTVPGYKIGPIKVDLAFGKGFDTNGSVTKITLMSDKVK